MKIKLSVTLDDELLDKLDEALSDGKFRNKSHFVEYAVRRLMEKHDGRNN